MSAFLKRVVAKFPEFWQDELKRHYYRRQISRRAFHTAEAEYQLLDQWVRPGDWVIDVGANVGHYTRRLSELVGPSGRVIAFEPVPSTFALLAANVRHFSYRNVTALNAAVSDRVAAIGMSVPWFATGLKNPYQAHLVAGGADADVKVLTLVVDRLGLDHRIAFIKIDAEGHEHEVLEGMQKLIRRDRPRLIVETFSDRCIAQLVSFGYAPERLPSSSNVTCGHSDTTEVLPASQ